MKQDNKTAAVYLQ